MISNEAYEELKLRKAEHSFSEAIMRLLNNKKNKTGIELKSCLGLIKEDNESKSVNETLKKGWKKWNKKYV